MLPAHQNACCSHDALDRHIWLSPLLAIKQAESIAKVLSDRFPEHRETFQNNLALCKSDLTQLDEEIRSLLGPGKRRAIVVSHAAFGYFCHDYEIEQLSVEEEGKEPRPRYLEAMLERAKESKASLVLTLPQHNNKGAELIAERLHITSQMLDPYSTNYFETLRHLTHLILKEMP